MKREDIIKLAWEADKFANKSAAPSGSEWWQLERDTHLTALVAAAERAEMAEHCVEITRMVVDKAVASAISEEREACAKVVEDVDLSPNPIINMTNRLAAAIRARGEK